MQNQVPLFGTLCIDRLFNKDLQLGMNVLNVRTGWNFRSVKYYTPGDQGWAVNIINYVNVEIGASVIKGVGLFRFNSINITYEHESILTTVRIEEMSFLIFEECYAMPMTTLFKWDSYLVLHSHKKDVLFSMRNVHEVLIIDVKVHAFMGSFMCYLQKRGPNMKSGIKDTNTRNWKWYSLIHENMYDPKVKLSSNSKHSHFHVIRYWKDTKSFENIGKGNLLDKLYLRIRLIWFVPGNKIRNRPLVKLLGHVDDEQKPSVGYIYEAMKRAKKATEEGFKFNSSKYERIMQIIDNRSVRARKEKSPAEWWILFGSSTPNLLRFAIKLLSLTCSHAAVREIGVYSTRSTQKEGTDWNKKRLNDLVFVKYNQKLKACYDNRKTIDPICLDNVDERNELHRK
ncbi:hypothetical protein CTI12_AA408640 [Artemisia annua]|uniref:HAT C-terminal dimerisation domain-containing protein n=1 Tax=Artemisia annua TaxID=35608 RepID=A0A2U1M8E8_ARTAN|nr:hypothetical protein CTI12_AA408640 [Artemisia annua]